MANFEGYLLAKKKIVNGVETLIEFPHKYIQVETWKSTPNQREEIKAVRDDNTRNLIRKTASGTKTSWEFQTRDDLHLSDKKAIQKFFTDAEVDSLERKVKLVYWNDEDNTYKESYFYRPNTDFTIKKITGNDIIYKSIEVKGIEY